MYPDLIVPLKKESPISAQLLQLMKIGSPSRSAAKKLHLRTAKPFVMPIPLGRPVSENVSKLYKILISGPVLPVILSSLQTELCGCLN